MPRTRMSFSSTGVTSATMNCSDAARAGVATISTTCDASRSKSSCSNAALPFLDSFTTWGSVLTTWMVARKILENWLYWLVIDGVSIYLYLDRELYFTALLFAVYIVIIFFGYYQWLQHLKQQRQASAAG